MSFILNQEVKDIRGNVLVKASTDIDAWVKKAIFSQDYLKKKSKFKEVPFFIEDCQAVFRRAPYESVLHGWAPNFREWMGEMWAPSVIFEELRLLKTLDPYSYQHVITISVVGARLLEIWIKAAPTIRRSFQALVCHRLGKTRLLDGLLQKEGDLSENEKKAIFEQPVVGFALNSSYWGDANHLCAKVALQHQEDRLGLGYPFKVKTNSLLLDILKLLDRFDALISQRPYRYKAFGVREAVDILKQDAEAGKFEEDVLKAFVDFMRKDKSNDYKKIRFGTIGRTT